MIVRFRLGNITETRPVHGKLDHHVSPGRKRGGFKQLHVSVEFTKKGNTLFCPVSLPKGNDPGQKHGVICFCPGRSALLMSSVLHFIISSSIL